MKLPDKEDGLTKEEVFQLDKGGHVGSRSER